MSMSVCWYATRDFIDHAVRGSQNVLTAYKLVRRDGRAALYTKFKYFPDTWMTSDGTTDFRRLEDDYFPQTTIGLRVTDSGCIHSRHVGYRLYGGALYAYMTYNEAETARRKELLDVSKTELCVVRVHFLWPHVVGVSCTSLRIRSIALSSLYIRWADWKAAHME